MKTYINLILAADVAAGKLPTNTVVGKAQFDGNWYTGFVAFDMVSGAPVIAEKSGGHKINWRKQG